MEGRAGIAALVGGVIGLLVGVVGAALLLNLAGQPSEADETIIQIGVRSGLLLVLFGGAVLGMITAAVVQVLAVPVGLDVETADESTAVRRRLSTGVGVPLAAFAVLALVVVALGSLFLAYHVAAPLLAIVVAGGILAFRRAHRLAAQRAALARRVAGGSSRDPGGCGADRRRRRRPRRR